MKFTITIRIDVEVDQDLNPIVLEPEITKKFYQETPPEEIKSEPTPEIDEDKLREAIDTVVQPLPPEEIEVALRGGRWTAADAIQDDNVPGGLRFGPSVADGAFIRRP